MEWMLANFEQVVYQKLNSDQKYYKAASKFQIVSWILETWNEISNETIKNSTNSSFLILISNLSFETCGFYGGGEEDREKAFKRAKSFSTGELNIQGDHDPVYVEEEEEEEIIYFESEIDEDASDDIYRINWKKLHPHYFDRWISCFTLRCAILQSFDEACFTNSTSMYKTSMIVNAVFHTPLATFFTSQFNIFLS